MNCAASFLPYQQTGYFSRIVLDYLAQSPLIRPFYAHDRSLEGIRSAMEAREQFPTDRNLLAEVLEGQYQQAEIPVKVAANIKLLRNPNCFTVCTAHQPNIFTGPLYFVYKILHAIKLAGELKQQFPDRDFVPVYYMGSEDADLEELGHIFIHGEKYTWETQQTGAVGRMKVDKALIRLLDRIAGQLLVHPHGAEIIDLAKLSYREGVSIQEATFAFVNSLFGSEGLIVLIPDHAALKRSFSPVIERELTSAFSHAAVQDTVVAFPPEYKVQASGRELNMFYLQDTARDRIEVAEASWSVVHAGLQFTREQLLNELANYPERFSPNVILRPVLQEWLLPNIAFIGGGGEIAYWLQLKKVFEAAAVPYPVLLLRNSFLFIDKETARLISKIKLEVDSLFIGENDLVNELVKRESEVQLGLEGERAQFAALYGQLKIAAARVDATLQQHVDALQTEALKKLSALEKKMLRAEKHKFEAEQRKLHRIKTQLFPLHNLQERIENLLPYYATFGPAFLTMISEHSNGLAQQFGILVEQ